MSLSDLSRQLSTVVQTLSPSVVMVDGGHRRGASGLVYSADGIIVTAAHKLVREDELKVGLAPANGTAAEREPRAAELVGFDATTDVAVLRIPGVTDLVPPTWAPADSLAVGALALAVARPGQSARAALGVLSTLSREPWTTPGGGQLTQYVETDIGGRAGFSGGALADAEGRVIGMSTGGLLRGSSLAVPYLTLARVVTAILGHGRVPRGWLGVGAYPVELPPKVAAEAGVDTGLVLVQVAPDGPGEQGGLLLGDVLLSIDGVAVPHVRALQAALVEGKALAVKLLRAGKIETLTVTAGARAV